jgi:hypothetical protein
MNIPTDVATPTMGPDTARNFLYVNAGISGRNWYRRLFFSQLIRSFGASNRKTRS